MRKLQKVILLYETSRGYSREIIRGVSRYCYLFEPWLCFSPTPLCADYYKNPGSLAWVKKINPDGIIISNGSKDFDKIIKLGIPTIVHRIIKNRHPVLPTIIGDGQSFGRTVAEYFLNKGFRNLAYCGHQDETPANERGEGFEQTANKAGCKVHLCIVKGSIIQKSLETEIPILDKWLRELPKPVAVMACNDEVSQNISKTCMMAGLKVPEEVAICGVANDEFICEFSSPPLSSLLLTNEEAGFEAARLLSKIMKGEEKPNGQTILVKPKYVVTRQSTDILAIDDPEVAKALNFIRESAKKTIAVEDVVAATYLSRRGLEKRFRSCLNRTILQEIRRRKLEEFTRLLLGTNYSISKIAEIMNTPDISNISRYFKAEKGMTPLDYRKKHGYL